jgi:GNAT superfamily N-acetyltransferase
LIIAYPELSLRSNSGLELANAFGVLVGFQFELHHCRMTDIQIRVATETDAPALARFRYELRSSKSHMIESDAEFIERCTVWMQERLRDDSGWRCWIAECDGTQCGNVWAQVVEKIPNPAAETECFVYLTNFYVREEYRGKGIGTRLLSEVLAWSKAKKAHTIILWPRERSKTLYARHGFAAAHDLMHLSLNRV